MDQSDLSVRQLLRRLQSGQLDRLNRRFRQLQ
jgi:hypothetical protein